MKTAKTLVIDLDSEPANMPAPYLVEEFDKQGRLVWDRKAFSECLYDPEFRNGLRARMETKEKGLRPCNGNLAFWLRDNPDQIPAGWKDKKILFMGVVIRLYKPMSRQEENQTCPMLEFNGDDWKLRVFNFSANKLEPEHRILVLPRVPGCL